MKSRRSELRGDPLTHRSRRSRSPLIGDKRQNLSQKRPYRFSGHRNASRERQQDHPLRRSDHGKDPVQGPSLPPQHMAHHRHGSLPPRDDGFRFQQNSIIPDQPSSDPTWRLSQPIKHGEFYSQINEGLPSSTVNIEGHRMLPPKQVYIHEGSSRLLYPDQPMGSTILDPEKSRTSGGDIGMGIRENEIHSFNDRHRAPYDGSIGLGIQDTEMHPYYGGHRDQYDDTDKKQAYSKDLSFSKMPTQPRTFLSAPSSSILKEELKELHHERIPNVLTPGVHRYSHDPLEHHSYHQILQPDPLRRDLPNETHAYDYDEFRLRGLDDHRLSIQEEPYKRIPHHSRMNVNSSTIMDYNEGWMDKADDSTNRTLIGRTFTSHPDSHYRDFTRDYRDLGAEQDLQTNSDNWYGGLQPKSSRDYETMPFQVRFTSKKEYFPASYREEHRNRRLLLPVHDLDQHRLVIHPHNRSHVDELSDYDIERMDGRHHAINGEVDEDDLRDVFDKDQHSSPLYESEELWLTEGPVGLPLSNSMFSEQSRYRKFSRSISTSDAFVARGASSMHTENDHNINIKRRLKRVRSDFHGSASSERRQDLLRSYKHGKRGMHERLGAQGGGSHESGSHFRKNDPPEDSEEFRQQVHKAFLRYSKLLNENPHGHKIYQNQGNPHSLLCCVCGSSSKEFTDTNNLAAHTYHSLKVGLKTEHLGFHKALCVLFGWNWRVPPDASRAYQFMPVAEAEAIREDLILWPPLVIIHNSSISGNGNNKYANDVTIQCVQKILRDMGFGTGMTGVSLGKPSNKGIFAVKFMPTFTGLQEAQRLHDHFSTKKHGKHEFRGIISNGQRNLDEVENPSKDLDAILYGFMAIAEDLDKLSKELKKRCQVKSRKDIQAIADAPLNTAD